MYINKESLRLEYQVEAKDAGLKVIDVLATSMNISSRLIRKCKNHKNIFLNHKNGSVNRIVETGDIITMMLDHDENTFEPNPIDVEVLYEDCDIMAVSKPPFLVVHPTKGHPEGTLANALSYHQYQQKQNYKIRFINRLDRDTSGIVLIAKNAYAQQIISEQMQADEVGKHYYAIVEGVLKDDSGTIDLPIDREAELDIKRIVIESGLQSVTHYEVVEKFENHTFIKIELETGRTHQIRVHFSHIGHSIVGDSLYGKPSEWIDRQALHCYEMSFKSPREMEKTSVRCKIPADIESVLKRLRG
ncbi:RluA family pseudouridine synthase [Fusibacter bizertensis]|uniref:Pseudouridine synthase n=1 Tax=Fusibacter bizertensis TaxID=1488331 RepID=A0ABT6NFD1_9FIRM|nr:RluA family pseudouridine synthase [Fusibacter bizertensis]MDH8679119.1 RluA family pseudouridine synthase [Fusibacter bizertensis]